MAVSNTSICNMALGKIGATRINNYDDAEDTSEEALQCRLHYEQTRNALLRSLQWPFAGGRETLSRDTETPDFEWAYQFSLPDDYLAVRSIHDGREIDNTRSSRAIEGDKLLSDQSAIELRYTKRVTDPTKFDSLFIEVLILKLALKLFAALSRGVDKDEIKKELIAVMRHVRMVTKNEARGRGRDDRYTWNDARSALGSRIDSQMGSD